MIANLLKRPIRTLLRAGGLEVRRLRPVEDSDRPFSVPATLDRARDLGLAPATVVDVGAAFGTFARECAAVFPAARYLLVEPLSECLPALQALTRELQRADVFPCAAGPAAGERVLHVHPDLGGSSFFEEHEDSDVNGVPRVVAVETVDAIVARADAAGPFLVKVDTQGAELEVLAGAAATLQRTEMVIAEVSLFRFFAGGPLLHDVVAFMRSREFVVYDVAGHLRRPLDGALAQLDLVFVREDGPFRQHHEYATRAQRDAQTRAFQAARPVVREE